MNEDGKERKYIRKNRRPVRTGLSERSPKYTIKYGFTTREEYEELKKQRDKKLKEKDVDENKLNKLLDLVDIIYNDENNNKINKKEHEELTKQEDMNTKTKKRKYVYTGNSNPVITGLAERSPVYTIKYGFTTREELEELRKLENQTPVEEEKTLTDENGKQKRKYVYTGNSNPVITGLAERSPVYTIKYGFTTREELEELRKLENQTPKEEENKKLTKKRN